MADHVIPMPGDTIDEALDWADQNKDAERFSLLADLDGKSYVAKQSMVPDGNAMSALVTYVEENSGYHLGGFVVLSDTSELPSNPSDPTIGYMIDNDLYVYVGTGGDTLDGKYQCCGPIQGQDGQDGAPGEQGPKGDKGDPGTYIDPANIDIFSSYSSLEGKTSEEKAAMIPDGNFIDDNFASKTDSDWEFTTEYSGISISNGKWITQSPRKFYMDAYTYQDGDVLIVKAGSNGSYFAFLADDSHVVGDDVDFAGTTGMNSVSANQEERFAIPSDTKYIWVNEKYDSTSYLPSKMMIESTRLYSVYQDGDDAIGLETAEKSAMIPSANVVEPMSNLLFPKGGTDTIENSDAVESNYSSYDGGGGYTRGFYFIKVSDYVDYELTLQVESNATIKYAIQLWTDFDFTTYIWDSGWITAGNSSTASKSTAPAAAYLAIVATYQATNKGIPPFADFLADCQFTFVGTYNGVGLPERVDNLEKPKKVIPIIDWTSQLTTASYVGEKIVFPLNTYTNSQVGTLQSGTGSRQGGAIFGDYLFQFHDTLANVCVFNLSTATNVQKITLTAIANCHAGSGGFSKTFYDVSDPFPLLYISSMDERKIYVFRITLVGGSYVMSKIQTITLATDYYLPNITIDAENGKIVIFAYTKNSWSDPTDNQSVVMACDIPSYSDDVTISEFENTFFLPFIYAEQGASAQYGTLYLSYGNTDQALGGGILVIDYMVGFVRSLVGLRAIGTLEPEALGIWANGLVFTTQSGVIYQILF